MLSSDKIILRPIEEEDLLFIKKIRNSVYLQKKVLSIARGENNEKIKKWFKSINKGPNIIFIILNKNNKRLGYIQLTQICNISKNAYLGIVLAREHQGKGIVSEAISLMLKFSKEVLGLHKIILNVLSENVKAIHCYKKIGFVMVGVLKENFFWNHFFLDVLLMEIIL
ncbi:MAG: GNAT family protein [Rickettsia endosymbiont of Ixodes persulcatus]|nr:GNAT family protein [Rickettsia endosymbiont of Ixodes persulcatus]